MLLGAALRRPPRADDHLSLVAGIRTKQVQAPAGPASGPAGTWPRPGRAARPPDRRSRVPASPPGQAVLQVRADELGGPCYEFVDTLDPLPPPSPGDLFLDLEGDGLALDRGLEYLFGLADRHATYHEFWADTRGEERLGSKRSSTSCVSVAPRIPACTCTTTHRTSPPRCSASRPGTTPGSTACPMYPPRRRLRRPLRDREAVAAAVDRVVRAQGRRAALPTPAPRRGARRRRELGRLRGAPARARSRDPRRPRPLQPRRLRVTPAAAGLARGTPTGGERGRRRRDRLTRVPLRRHRRPGARSRLLPRGPRRRARVAVRRLRHRGRGRPPRPGAPLGLCRGPPARAELPADLDRRRSLRGRRPPRRLRVRGAG